MKFVELTNFQVSDRGPKHSGLSLSFEI